MVGSVRGRLGARAWFWRWLEGTRQNARSLGEKNDFMHLEERCRMDVRRVLVIAPAIRFCNACSSISLTYSCLEAPVIHTTDETSRSLP